MITITTPKLLGMTLAKPQVPTSHWRFPAWPIHDPRCWRSPRNWRFLLAWPIHDPRCCGSWLMSFGLSWTPPTCGNTLAQPGSSKPQAWPEAPGGARGLPRQPAVALVVIHGVMIHGLIHGYPWGDHIDNNPEISI